MIKSVQKNSGRKRILTAGVLLAAVVLAAILIFHLPAAASSHPLLLLLLAAVISLALPMLRANLFPSARDCDAEYDFHEQRLEEQNRREISGALGEETFNRIGEPSGGPDESAEVHFRQLLEKEPVGRDPALRFALLLTIARYWEKAGDARKSTQYLTEALTINPNHFIANFRLAIINEWMGAVDNAVRYYEQALLDPGGISRGMRKLAMTQISRLQSGSQ